MIEVAISCAFLALAQQPAAGKEMRSPDAWREFYQSAATQYTVKHVGDGTMALLKENAVFEWASINNYHGAVFAWTDQGRPACIATIFSFPMQDSKQRLAVHEFASFADAEVVVNGPGGIDWSPPPLADRQRVPDAPPPPRSANLLKLHGRRLAKDFSAHMNRRGERWDLRLLPTPLLEYYEPSKDILGGALFAFVGYSTDPEILLLLEARDFPKGPAWCFHPVRFSDKSLYLSFKDKPIWESTRMAHGGGPDSEDPLYRVLSSERISPEVVEKNSAAPREE
jgi:hypothetical protein